MYASICFFKYRSLLPTWLWMSRDTVLQKSQSQHHAKIYLLCHPSGTVSLSSPESNNESTINQMNMIPNTSWFSLFSCYVIAFAPTLFFSLFFFLILICKVQSCLICVFNSNSTTLLDCVHCVITTANNLGRLLKLTTEVPFKQTEAIKNIPKSLTLGVNLNLSCKAVTYVPGKGGSSSKSTYCWKEKNLLFQIL